MNAAKQIRDNCIKLRSAGCTLKGLYRICFDGPDEPMTEFVRNGFEESLTRGEVKALCEKAAARLREKTGETGRYIGLYSDNRPGWIVLFWAILRSGNRPCLMNTVQPKAFNRRILETLEADTVVYAGGAPGIAETEILMEELTGDGNEAEKIPEGAAFGSGIAVTTSGTTLQEKICVFTEKEIAAQILNCGEIIRTNPDICKARGDRIRMLMLLPLYHIFGLEATFLWFILAGAVFVFPADRKPDTILATIRERRVTHVFAVPLFWRTVEKEMRRALRGKTEAERDRFEKAVKRSLKLQDAWDAAGRKFAGKAFRKARSALMGDQVTFCITGGSAIREDTLEIFNAIGYPLRNGYGMSEAGITSVELSRRAKDRRQNAIGKPFGSVRYRIDEAGRLQISGESVCRTTYIDGKRTETGEWLESGDLADRDGDGRYYIRGRESDLVFGEDGEKLNPDIAEKAFDIPWATAFSVLGDRENRRLEMVVQVPEGLVDIQRQQIETAFEQGNRSLPVAYQIRKVYYTFDPILPEGGVKVSRALLRHRLEDGSVRPAEAPVKGAAPDTGGESDVKRILRGLIAEVLDTDAEKIGDDAHFINDLGGSSLDYLSLISAIDNRFGITLDFEGEASDYSLNDLARSVEERLC